MKRIITILLVFISLQMSGQCWQKVSKGVRGGAGIKSDGTLWIWGSNDRGQIGDGTTTNSLIPKQFGTGTNWVMVETANATTIALKSDGTLWSWGHNSNGQLGTGTTIGPGVSNPIPTQIGTDTDWQTIACGYSHCKAIKTNGTLWAWGNVTGNGIAGIAGYSNVPIQIGTSTWSKIATGRDHTLAIKSDGTLWSWGSNGDGQVGNNTSGNEISSPVQIGTFNDWQSITAGEKHSMAVRTVPGIYVWGSNDTGELGFSVVGENVLTPSLRYTDATWASVSAGNGHTLALKSDGTLWSWGSNSLGQLGRSATTPASIGQVGTDLWQKVNAGDLLTFGLKSDGSLWSWGYQGTAGYLGIGTTVQAYSSPQAIGCPTSALGNSNFENNNSEIKAYPNPVKNVLNLSFETTITSVSLYNLLGQEVVTKAINDNEGTIDASNIESGTYFVKVFSNNLIKTIKIIKE